MNEDFEDFHNEDLGVGQDLDPSVFFYPEPYCGIVNEMRTSCFEMRYINHLLTFYFIILKKILVFVQFYWQFVGALWLCEG